MPLLPRINSGQCALRDTLQWQLDFIASLQMCCSHLLPPSARPLWLAKGVHKALSLSLMITTTPWSMRRARISRR